MNDYTRTGEFKLWVAVLEQAWKDATMRIKSQQRKKRKKDGSNYQYNTKPGDSVAAQVDARRWFSENSDDFKLVCELAGQNPEYVRRLARRKLGIKGIF